MIKAIFFDFDGVLTIDNKGSATTCKNIQKYLPDVAFDDILKCYRVHHQNLLIGKTTHALIWKDFCECIGHNIDIEILYNAFKNIPINQGMFDLCKNLKKNYRLGIITDNNKERFDVLKKDLKLNDIFDPIIVSGETGCKKDDQKTFLHALKLTKLKPTECIFIDNDKLNLIEPKKMGWQTIFHDDQKNDIPLLIKEIERLLKLTP